MPCCISTSLLSTIKYWIAIDSAFIQNAWLWWSFGTHWGIWFLPEKGLFSHLLSLSCLRPSLCRSCFPRVYTRAPLSDSRSCWIKQPVWLDSWRWTESYRSKRDIQRGYFHPSMHEIQRQLEWKWAELYKSPGRLHQSGEPEPPCDHLSRWLALWCFNHVHCDWGKVLQLFQIFKYNIRFCFLKYMPCVMFFHLDLFSKKVNAFLPWLLQRILEYACSGVRLCKHYKVQI